MAHGQSGHNHTVWNREEALRLQRQNAAAQKAAERERKLDEIASGKAEAERLNDDLAARVTRLEFILRRGLERKAAIDLNAMVWSDEFPPLDLGPFTVAHPRPIWSNYVPPEPRAIAGLLSRKSRRDRQLAAARENFERAELDYNRVEAERQEWVRQETSRYEAVLGVHREEVAHHNRQLALIAAGLRDRDRQSVQSYLQLVLSQTLLPDDVPHQAEVAYSPRGEQVVVRFELPAVDVVPKVESYRYVTTTATLREKKRSMVQVAQLYRSVVSQITLLYMRDLFESDPELNNVELGGHVHFVNPATGQPEYPCLITIAVDRSRYTELNLREVEPDVCLRHLNALVSGHPHLVEPVTPVRDFDLARYSFVEKCGCRCKPRFSI